uniref:P0 n=1 Tax=Cucurbit aphid-borne yellows virus TaxID=91753 RepID=A0A7G7Y7U8_9VIRU|nr:P0 [Cucurbit aphid-borne yellows virus]
MQIESVKQQLVFRPRMGFERNGRILSISEFLTDYQFLNLFNAEYGVSILRFFLARLPLLISEQLSGDHVYTPGANKRIPLARFHRHCGAPLSSSSAVDLRLPTRKDVARFFLARHYSRAMGERLRRRPTDLFGGYAKFERFINVWWSFTARRLKESTPRHFESIDLCVELSDLGHRLRYLVLVTGLHNRSALTRLALHVHRVYGEDGGLDFWRLANFPSKSWPYNSERHFEGSVVQKELQS